MKPRPFDYLRATSLGDVFAAFAEHGENAQIIAGGQSVLPALNMRLSEPAILVDIGRLSHLDFITEEDGSVRVGALSRHEVVRTSPLIAARVPMISAALSHVAHPAIRNRGTFGGSLSNADPASELPACVLALGATMTVENANGKRTVDARDFFTGLFETSLAPGDVLTEVSVPTIAGDEMHFFDEIARRRGDYALAGLAATARREGNALSKVRFAFHSCGDRPTLAHELARLAEGADPKNIDQRDIDAALAADLDPPSDDVTDADTRLHLAGVLARRAIAQFASGRTA